ncbi:MAG: GNAT family N-acetyltransferase [Desulfotomaculales bacterium]
MESRILIFTGDYDKKEFYSLMGEVFASKEVRKKLPYLYNEPGRTWFLFLDENSSLAGFVSYLEKKNKITFKNDFVFPAYKGEEIFAKLNEARSDYVEKTGKPVEVVAPNDLIPMYEKMGFTAYRRTKNYAFMRKEVVKDEAGNFK